MNYDRIYQYRFKGIDDKKKLIAWQEISAYISKRAGNPAVILDPAAGKCEFINTVPGKEKWAVDLNDYFIKQHAGQDIKLVIGDVLKVDLPANHFDLVFISNFLEHLNSQEEVAVFLGRMHQCLKPGGRIVVMGPNFKYAYREYFDFADHTVILSELGLAEHLYGAGFGLDHIYPRFLPLSFRSGPPIHRFLIQLYLNVKFFWIFFGKQFLVIGTKR